MLTVLVPPEPKADALPLLLAEGSHTVVEADRLRVTQNGFDYWCLLRSQVSLAHVANRAEVSKESECELVIVVLAPVAAAFGVPNDASM